MTARGAMWKLGTLGMLGFFVLGVSARVSQKTLTYKGLPQDWSSQRVFFTMDSLAKHPGLINSEPRVMLQLLRRAKSGLRPVQSLALPAITPLPNGVGWSFLTGAGKMLIGNSPAEFTLDLANPSCTNDYVVFTGNAVGSSTQATLIGLNDLYTGPNAGATLCGQTSPNPYFAYNTSTLTNGKIRTSPIISLDGTKIAFVESNSATSVLHVLKFQGNSLTSCLANGCNAKAPAVPGVGNAASMVNVTYANANNTRSSPWMDYANDTIYVGANDGAIHKITGVFKGTPTAVNSGGWPVVMPNLPKNLVLPLSSPVQDPVTGNIFVGDNRGFLNSFSYVNPGPVSSLAIGASANGLIQDSPLVDSGNGIVFATSAFNGTGGALVEASTSTLAQLASVSLGLGSQVGVTPAVVLYDGYVDNAYLNGGPAAGHMYACGTGPADTTPYLYRFPFSAGKVIQPANSVTQIVNSTTARCSPMTEFFNASIGVGGTDFLFWGVTDSCVGSTGCVMSLSNGTAIQKTSVVGGTSAIVVDNDTSQPGTSNIYFSNESNPLNANRVNQSNLQ